MQKFNVHFALVDKFGFLSKESKSFEFEAFVERVVHDADADAFARDFTLA